MRLSLSVPAKFNSFLHILDCRDDDYHESQTLFQSLDHGNELHFETRQNGQVRLYTEITEVPHDSDLVVRAVHGLQEASGSLRGVDIRLDKRLPMGGGIGSGSSDAATTLLALNYFWQLGQDEDRIAVLGLRLGADVPVFTRGRAASAEGVGEKLTLMDIPEPQYLVVVPQVLVSTAEIFPDPLLTRDSLTTKVRTALEGDSRNDCRPVIERRYPEVRNALILPNKFVSARLTGTGGCVSGSFPNKTEADKISALPPDHLQRFVVRGSNASMLYRKLETLV